MLPGAWVAFLSCESRLGSSGFPAFTLEGPAGPMKGTESAPPGGGGGKERVDLAPSPAAGFTAVTPSYLPRHPASTQTLLPWVSLLSAGRKGGWGGGCWCQHQPPAWAPRAFLVTYSPHTRMHLQRPAEIWHSRNHILKNAQRRGQSSVVTSMLW